MSITSSGFPTPKQNTGIPSACNLLAAATGSFPLFQSPSVIRTAAAIRSLAVSFSTSPKPGELPIYVFPQATQELAILPLQEIGDDFHPLQIVYDLVLLFGQNFRFRFPTFRGPQLVFRQEVMFPRDGE